MTETPAQQPRVLIAAFQGWSDAGDATTEVLQHLGELLEAEPVHVIGAEGYVDFQVHRPKIVRDADGNRALDWPDTRLFAPVMRPGLAETLPELESSDSTFSDADSDPVASRSPQSAPESSGAADADLASVAGLTADACASDADASTVGDASDGPTSAHTDSEADAPRETVRRLDGSAVTNVYLLAGVEPARDWQNFADEIVELADVWGIDTVILLGSLYSDAPHSRPIVTTLSSENEKLREETGAVPSTYEGPAGISTVLELALIQAAIPTVSLWAQVPHYVHSTPSPKATLALLDKLEELLDIVIPRGDLLVQANEWESNINRIAASDEEMTRYIRRLEESRDDALAAETTGDAIAMEFEKFLERGRTLQTQELAESGSDTNSTDANDSDAQRDSAEAPTVDPEQTEGDPSIATNDADTNDADSDDADSDDADSDDADTNNGADSDDNGR